MQCLILAESLTNAAGEEIRIEQLRAKMTKAAKNGVRDMPAKKQRKSQQLYDIWNDRAIPGPVK